MTRVKHGLPGIYNSSAITLSDEDGAALALDSSGRLTLGSITPGTAAANLGKAEDAAHASGDTGIMLLAVRNDALAALAGADGDYAPLQVSAVGGLYVTHGYQYDYQAAASADVVTKSSAGFLHAIIVGDAVASAIIEVSDHASDGDGAVRIYLAGDTLGPAVYPVDAEFATGICSDITNQTHVTFVYR